MTASPHLTPIARTSVSDEIVKRLLGLILDERLRPGDRLPTERALMGRLAVGRSSLREAIKTLSALGIVRVAVGEGMFVGDGDTAAVARPVSWALLMSEGSTREVIEARRAVELELAGLAAERASPAEVAAIGERLAAMRASRRDAEAYSRCDVEFHLAIARAAHNRVLLGVLETLRHLLRVWIVEVQLDYEDKSASLAEHIPIYAAIQARDAAGARRAMAAHLDSAGRRLLAIVATHAGDDARRRAAPP
jgi:GntR family transcriptional repressor for pyruvate dehydrogenase complex